VNCICIDKENKTPSHRSSKQKEQKQIPGLTKRILGAKWNRRYVLRCYVSYRHL